MKQAWLIESTQVFHAGSNSKGVPRNCGYSDSNIFFRFSTSSLGSGGLSWHPNTVHCFINAGPKYDSLASLTESLPIFDKTVILWYFCITFSGSIKMSAGVVDRVVWWGVVWVEKRGVDWVQCWGVDSWNGITESNDGWIERRGVCLSCSFNWWIFCTLF